MLGRENSVGGSIRFRLRRGQANLEYGIVLAILVIGSLVGAVLLSQKLANLASYSIEVSTYDENGATSLNPSIDHAPPIPIAENQDEERILEGPSNLQDNTGIENIGELLDSPD